MTLRLLLLIVLTRSLPRTDSKCSTTFLTTCEKISDVSKYGNPSWSILMVKKDDCKDATAEQREVLSAGVFNSTSNLEQLYIAQKVSSVEEGVFAGLKELWFVKLWGNQLTVLQRGSFGHFQRLHRLDLTKNDIENLAHGFLVNSSVREVDLSHNRLTNIQVDTLDSPSLESISLAYNCISMIAPKAFNKNLIKLQLNYNNIDSFQPETLDILSNLKELDLSHNQLTVTTFIPGLESLEVLDLSDNSIERILPGTFSGLRELKALYLDNNRLKSLAPQIFGARLYVRILRIHQNNLSSLSGLIGEALPDLREITVGGNPWFCECLLAITQYIETRSILMSPCERDYLRSGKSPICVQTRADCEKNNGLSENEYEDFKQVSAYECGTS